MSPEDAVFPRSQEHDNIGKIAGSCFQTFIRHASKD